MTEPAGVPASVVGRLLEEISWERATAYREGGRGRENVLVAEVLMALDFLPRTHFLGALVTAATGANEARALLASEIEQAAMDFLPGDMPLSTGPSEGSLQNSQPDALLTTPGTFVLVEAKRIRSSSFQPLQLEKELVAARVHSAGRMPVVFLLGVTPPVLVRGKGRMPLKDAAGLGLESVLVQSGNGDLVANELLDNLDQVFCWISWAEVETVIRRQMGTFRSDDPSVASSVQRLAASITSAIAWHS